MNTTTDKLAEALCEALDYLAEFMEEGREHRVIRAGDAALAEYEAQRQAQSAAVGEHTPEPWHADGQSVTAGETCIRPCIVWGSGADFEAAAAIHKANARRIVACVNACAGFPTEALERRGLSEAVWRD